MSEPDEAMVEAVAQYGEVWLAVEGAMLAIEGEVTYQSLADAALSVPVVRDALARDAQVREIATKWPERRNEPWPLTLALEVADEVAALYPSPGDRDDSEEQK